MPPGQTPSPNVQETGTAIGSELCLQCGLCCTGALHHYAVLEPGETEFAESLGLTLRTSGRPGFHLPCPLLKGCACSIYTSRPAVCGRYKCQLLQDVEGGVTGLSTAVGKIRAAKALVKGVEGQLPPSTTLPDARERYLRETDPAGLGLDSMPLKLALTALCLYLDTHFKHGQEAKLLTLEPVRSREDQLEME